MGNLRIFIWVALILLLVLTLFCSYIYIHSSGNFAGLSILDRMETQKTVVFKIPELKIVGDVNVHLAPNSSVAGRRNCQESMKLKTVQKLRNNILVFPNYSVPYNLTEKNPKDFDFSQFKEGSALLQAYFPGKLNRFFIEAGAWNGEEISNTLQAEYNYNWTGLLVEPGKESFQAMRSKNRKSVLLEGCLADVCGIEERTLTGWGIEGKQTFQCFSIQDVLAAINVYHVDWMVLDIEGYEGEIFRSFPWSTVTVDLIQVEVVQSGVKNTENMKYFKKFLGDLGYEEEASILIDMIFRRKLSTIGHRTTGPKFGDGV